MFKCTLYTHFNFDAQILLEKLNALEMDRQFTKHFNFITKLSRFRAAEDIKCSLHASVRKIKFKKRRKKIFNKCFFLHEKYLRLPIPCIQNAFIVHTNGSKIIRTVRELYI